MSRRQQSAKGFRNSEVQYHATGRRPLKSMFKHWLSSAAVKYGNSVRVL